ncbi:heterodisulfide reductase subunit D [Candidatus Acidianus copahuensis]|uniref:Heterodisulfide reductase subunit D n=1 Tax=Candidatus Acidianus copahuensis TaxID=1160895 RepID=A0A031LQ65_9CREN|nr:(Fe-S)-binding protein [Candidatus Acidianus copahuensis]EZQ09966.1 heterodisulfide reductase subunit D [Candidatus Acidianus copahuensis]
MNNIKFLGKMIVENLKTQGMPFPTDPRVCTGWAKDLPRKSDTIIFTSCMYQIEPIVPTLSKFLPSAEKLKSLMPLSRLLKPTQQQIQRSYRILNNIVLSLKQSGINVGYLYEEEPYSGALLLELGLLDEFSDWAKHVASLFREKGIRKVITVDPHTHNALTRYGEFTQFEVEVISYLELVTPKKVEGEYVVHDSCLYSRFLGLREKYRSLIERSGIKTIEDPMITGKDTSACCGGPLAPVDREVSEKIASNRTRDLEKLGNKLLVLCPICYVTLSPHFSGEVLDLAEVIL